MFSSHRNLVNYSLPLKQLIDINFALATNEKLQKLQSPLLEYISQVISASTRVWISTSKYSFVQSCRYLIISPLTYSVRMRENAGKMRTRITLNADSFYAMSDRYVIYSFYHLFGHILRAYQPLHFMYTELPTQLFCIQLGIYIVDLPPSYLYLKLQNVLTDEIIVLKNFTKLKEKHLVFFSKVAHQIFGILQNAFK